jgi:hypothetical protein
MAMLMAAALLQSDGTKTAKDAIDKVLAASSYKVKFQATIKTPGSDPLVLDGETVRLKGGVLFIHSKASGGDEKRIIRVGDDVWLYHEVAEEWVTAADAANPGAGRGVQNPDEVLGVVVNHLGKATLTADGKTVDLKVDGDDIEKIMKEQTKQGALNFKESSAEVQMGLADGKLKQFTCVARLASTDPALKGQKVEYSAKVEVLSYDQERSMTFTIMNAKLKKAVEIGVPAEIKERIEKASK